MNAIAQTLEALQLAPAQTHLNLSIYPLLSPEPLPQVYLTLDEALEQQLARVTELTQGGVVPELRFDNLSDRQVLLLDGEALAEPAVMDFLSRIQSSAIESHVGWISDSASTIPRT